MKVIFLILLAVFLYLNQFSQSEEIEILNQPKESIYNYFKCTPHKNSNFSGTDTITVDSITIYIEYKEGKKYSAKGYYSNDSLYRETYYNGKTFNGFNIRYYKNGQKAYQGYYENGKLIPPTISWYENGNYRNVNDCNSENEGTSVFFHENGRVSHIEKYYGSAYDFQEFYDTGELEGTCKYFMGVQKHLRYYKNGNKYSEGNINDDYLYKVGKWQEWYENGVLKKEYFYSEDTPNLKTGTWSYWDEKGNLTKQETYQNGNLIDEQKFIPVGNKKH